MMSDILGEEAWEITSGPRVISDEPALEVGRILGPGNFARDLGLLHR